MHPLLARRGRLLPYLAACAPLAAIVTALLARREVSRSGRRSRRSRPR